MKDTPKQIKKAKLYIILTKQGTKRRLLSINLYAIYPGWTVTATNTSERAKEATNRLEGVRRRGQPKIAVTISKFAITPTGTVTLLMMAVRRLTVNRS